MGFKKAEELRAYAEELKNRHAARISEHMQLQAMWQQPIQKSSTGRVLYRNNEPWTATRLIVSLIDTGRLTFKGSMPPDGMDAKDRNSAISSAEKLLAAHFRQTDFQMFEKRRAGHRRQLAFYMAVYGWHAGINLVLDGMADGEGWPILSDVWSPVDTFPDMDGDAVVHFKRMRWKEIRKTFGKDRPGKKLPGYEFKPPDNTDDDDVFVVTDIYTREYNAACVDDQWLKRETPHGLGHNPAWCNPVDAAPFRSSAVDNKGKALAVPDTDSNEWLAYTGQSPMFGYKTAYQYHTQLMNQIADVIERWSSPLVLVKTRDGKYQYIDINNPEQKNVDLETVVEVISPPKFPMDDRVWAARVEEDIAKASFSKMAYGAGNPAEAAQTMELIRASSQYIVQPIVNEMEWLYDKSVDSILRQLEKKGKQYLKHFRVRTAGPRVKATYDYMKLNELPEGVSVAVSLKGAGIAANKLQALQAVTLANNAQHPVLPLETLLDEFLESEDPPGEISRLFWEKMTMNQRVYDVASPAVTLLDLAQRVRMKGSKKAVELADALEAQGQAAINDMRAAAQPEPKNPQPQGPAGPEGPPPPPPPPGAGLTGEAQMTGMSNSIGPPPAGTQMPPTGPDPLRGDQMALAAQLAPPV